MTTEQTATVLNAGTPKATRTELSKDDFDKDNDAHMKSYSSLSFMKVKS